MKTTFLDYFFLFILSTLDISTIDSVYHCSAIHQVFTLEFMPKYVVIYVITMALN